MSQKPLMIVLVIFTSSTLIYSTGHFLLLTAVENSYSAIRPGDVRCHHLRKVLMSFPRSGENKGIIRETPVPCTHLPSVRK